MSEDNLAQAVEMMAGIDLEEEVVDDTVVVEEPSVEEEPVVVEEPAVEEPPKLAKKLAKLAQKEAHLLELETTLKKMHEDVQSKMAIVDRLQAAKDDPLLFLKESGVDIDLLSRQLLHGEKVAPKDPVISSLESQIKELSEMQKQLLARDEERRAKETEYQEGARQRAVQQWRDEISEHITSMTEESLLKANPQRSIRKIEQVVRDHYAKTKQILALSDAAGRIEKELETEYQSLSSIAQKKQSRSPQQKPRGSSTQTLTPNGGQRVAKTIKEMSDAERLAHAAQLLDELEI